MLKPSEKILAQLAENDEPIDYSIDGIPLYFVNQSQYSDPDLEQLFTEDRARTLYIYKINILLLIWWLIKLFIFKISQTLHAPILLYSIWTCPTVLLNSSFLLKYDDACVLIILLTSSLFTFILSGGVIIQFLDQ